MKVDTCKLIDDAILAKKDDLIAGLIKKTRNWALLNGHVAEDEITEDEKAYLDAYELARDINRVGGSAFKKVLSKLFGKNDLPDLDDFPIYVSTGVCITPLLNKKYKDDKIAYHHRKLNVAQLMVNADLYGRNWSMGNHEKKIVYTNKYTSGINSFMVDKEFPHWKISNADEINGFFECLSEDELLSVLKILNKSL